MKRFNYVVTPSERFFGVTFSMKVQPALRAPLVALAGALIVTGLGYGAQAARLHAADAEAAALALRLSATEAAVARVTHTRDEVERLRSLARRLDAMRESGDLRADELAALGNGVPAGAWLTSIRVASHGLDVEGRSARLDAVGATLAALGHLPAYRRARLLHVRADAPRPGVSYALALETAP